MEDVTSAKVALLYGGLSSEREISLQSGTECAQALKEAGFNKVDLIDIGDASCVTAIAEGNYDVAFVALHGRYGEDGCVQGFLELLGIPYTFSGVTASAVAADKAMAKDIYREHGIPTPKGICLLKGDTLDVDATVKELGLPLFVKPVANGSSFGVTRVAEAKDLQSAVDEAFVYDNRLLIETAIIGTEITVPVLGNTNPEALPIVEIRYDADFYDLSVKYDDPTKHHVIPPELPDEVIAKAGELACRAHKALGCAGVSRSDFIVTEDGTPTILETNIIPGMTASSLLPDAARRAGTSFPELCKKLIELAFERAEREGLSR